MKINPVSLSLIWNRIIPECTDLDMYILYTYIEKYIHICGKQWMAELVAINWQEIDNWVLID